MGFGGVFPAWWIGCLSGSNESGIDTKLGCHKGAAVAGEYVNHQAFCSVLVLQASLRLVAAQGEEDATTSACGKWWEALCHIVSSFSSPVFPFPVAFMGISFSRA